jgi:hypothetical protein
MVRATAGGSIDSNDWSVRSNLINIAPGDTAYLLRQGQHGRGIVAKGDVKSHPWQSPDIEEPGAWPKLIDIQWLESVRLADRIDVETLARVVPGVGWQSIYFSGFTVPDPSAQLLADAWGRRHDEAWPSHNAQTSSSAGSTYFADVDPLVSSAGAGFGDSKRNAEVEDAALQFAKRCYKQDGYDVNDVSALKCGWDLTLRRQDEEWHVELKGVSGTRPTILLTANERRAASEDACWILSVVSSARSKPRLQEFDRHDVVYRSKPYAYRVDLDGKNAIAHY